LIHIKAVALIPRLVLGSAQSFGEAFIMEKSLNPAALSRRTALRCAMLLSATPLLTLASGPAEAKIAQTSVAYQPGPKGEQQCSNCNLYVTPASCKTVDGVVAPAGWCKIWVKKPA